MEAVRTVHSVSGSFDMIIIVEAPSVAELDAVIRQEPGVGDYDQTF